MTDLRALLGDRYDDVIEKALIAADEGEYYVARGYIDEGDVGKILAAVLPDLLAEAWDEGYTRGFYDREQLSPDMPGRDASEGATLNPYRRGTDGTEEADR